MKLSFIATLFLIVFISNLHSQEILVRHYVYFDYGKRDFKKEKQQILEEVLQNRL